MDLVRRVGLSPNVRKKNLPFKGRIFGVPLDHLTAKSDNAANVPNIVIECAEFIRHHGLHEEGLFRVSGNRRLIEQLRSEFDQSGTGNLSASSHDVSVVTSVFKMFFRELPEPLIPEEEILAITENQYLSESELVDSIKACCKTLPAANFSLLRYLCSFLHEVGQNVAETKMTDSSLAIVFGPNLFRIENDLEALQRQPTITRAMSCLIRHHSQIFNEKEEEVNEVKKTDGSNMNGVIKVESVTHPQSSAPCFIIPAKEASAQGFIRPNHSTTGDNLMENVKDWDDSWLSGLAQDSPSPETEDILARSHDSLSSMSPLTGSGNLSLQFNLQQTIKECIWEMMIPTPSNSDHSFNIYNGGGESNGGGASSAVKRKEPRNQIMNRCSNGDLVKSTEPSRDDDIFNFTNHQPLKSITKGRASPNKRKEAPKQCGGSSAGVAVVPKLNLLKLSKVENLSDVSNQNSPKTSPKTTTSSTSSVASLNRKITLLKQQVSTFDQNFEKIHNRPPLGDERRPIATIVKELNEMKRQLFDMKSMETSQVNGALSSQFSLISLKIDERRKLAGRPHDLAHMSQAQLNDEKLCIQKLLLQFEETHGRPKTKDQKDLMRPIYDRYRKVKLAIHSTDNSDAKRAETSLPNTGDTCLNDTWNVTLGHTASGMEQLMSLSPEGLICRMKELQDSKRSLRKTLRDFEKSFLARHGRKVMKEDRGPRESEYNEYKRVKAKIRLIDSLLNKKSEVFDCK